MPEFDVVIPREGSNHAVVSIVTFVYDRVDALRRSIQSVRRLNFQQYEHIIVADGPPLPVLHDIETLVREYGCEQTRVLALRDRKNDWGVTPAALGLSQAAGRYVCFLADDNGCLPEHFDELVPALETDAALGFAYSSCLYDGRRVLDAPSPQAGQIDLGQPLFRRQLFDVHLGGTLPFHGFGWDWRMIERFLGRGVSWKHINRATLIYRLRHYPKFAADMTALQRETPAAAV
jgi:Glycosyl transferase family 2